MNTYYPPMVNYRGNRYWYFILVLFILLYIIIESRDSINICECDVDNNEFIGDEDDFSK